MGPVVSSHRHDLAAFRLLSGVVHRRVRSAWLLLLLCLGLATEARAALQFDVFLGYDDNVREGNWFPVACEVQNDGPSFQAVFELSSGQLGAGQTRTLAIELPTNTRKRFVIPAFASTRYSVWDARLLDARGRVIAEKLGMRPKDMSWSSHMMGAVSRSFGGLPSFPDTKKSQPEFQPRVARMQLEVFPDSPLALEGLNSIYINSEKALELKTPQIAALLGWLYDGGHLVVAVEQPGDVNATPWLRQLLPMDVTNVVTRPIKGELQAWLNSTTGTASSLGEEITPPVTRLKNNRNLPKLPNGQRYGINGRNAPVDPAQAADPLLSLQGDDAFDAAELATISGTPREGRVVISLQGAPLAVTAPRGRGQVTVLAFSPEREPFRAWKNRGWFWVKLLNLPKAWFGPGDFNAYSSGSVDSVIGALIDSRQVRKLPVEWLLLLLVVYLVVIGPFDQYWLKKINKQMLTWITFPAYVAIFSLLIYFIASKLRAGETEWNELHIVDVLPRGERAELRGRTFGSMYSPVNAQYKLVNTNQGYATLRGEHQGNFGGQESSKARVQQRGNGFEAEVQVPVWTSQLFIHDWMQPADQPVTATVTQDQGRYFAVIQNHLSHDLENVHIAVNGMMFTLNKVPAGKTTSATLENGDQLSNYVFNNANGFQNAVNNRRQAFGRESGHLEDAPNTAMAASFIGQYGNNGQGFNQGTFSAPLGFSLDGLVERGDAVLLAWYPGESLTSGAARFKAVRNSQNTLIRLAVPVTSTTGDTAKPRAR